MKQKLTQEHGKYADMDLMWKKIKLLECDSNFTQANEDLVRRYPEIVDRSAYNYYEEITKRIFRKVCL